MRYVIWLATLATVSVAHAQPADVGPLTGPAATRGAPSFTWAPVGSSGIKQVLLPIDGPAQDVHGER